MPLDFVSGLGFDFSTFTGGATPRLPDGGVELARPNAILSQWLRELEADGAPSGWSRSHVPVDEGYDVYIGATRASMTRHNTSPINPEDDAYQFNSPVVGGASPPNRNTPGIALLADDPDKPTLEKIVDTDVGYPQGTYLAAKTTIGKSGKSHTLLSPTVLVTVSSNGQSLEWQASVDLPEEAWGEGLWLSKGVTTGDPDSSTMRLQAIRKKGPRTYTTRGALKLGTYARKPPTRNETKIGISKPLRKNRDFHVRGGQSRDLQQGLYIFELVQTTALGESLPSPLSDPLRIDKERSGHCIKFHPEVLHPDASGYKIFCRVDDVVNPATYQLVRVNRSGDRMRAFRRGGPNPILYGYIDSGDGSTAIPIVSAEHDRDDRKAGTNLNGDITATATSITVSGSAGFPASPDFYVKVETEIMLVTAGQNTNNWTVVRGQLGTKAAEHEDNRRVIYDSEKENKEKRDRLPHHLGYILIPQDEPTEDTTGIEDPTGDIDAPVPIGIGRPPLGTWWIGYNRRFDGKPTQASEPKKVTITSSEVIELHFPARVNKLFNALYGQLNQKGIPRGWTFVKQDGTTYTTPDAQMIVAAGKVRLQTSGAPSDALLTPRAHSYNTLDPTGTLMRANPNRLERIRATLEVSSYVSGRAFVDLMQFDSTGTVITGATISLGTLSQSGYLYINKSIGAASLSPDISLDDDVTYLGIRWGLENGGSANRNLRASVYNIYLHPFDGSPRVYEERSAPDELWQPSLDPASPVPASHVLAIGPPPETPGNVPVGSAALNTVNHSSGSVTVGSGSLPSGFVVNRSHLNPDNEATIVATTVFGSSQNAAKFRSDDVTNTNTNYFEKDYTGLVSGTSLAQRLLLYIDRLPTRDPSILRVASIRDAGGTALAWLRLNNAGNLHVFAADKSGAETNAVVASSLGAGDIVEVEFLVGGGTSSAGNVSTNVGVNGAPLAPGPNLSGIDYTGLLPRVIRYGGFNESVANTKWTLYFDDVIPTRSGYAATLPAPATGPALVPDIPQISGVFREEAQDGDPINQGYAFFLESDVIRNTKMGYFVEEYFVFPETTRTAAVFLREENIPANMRIFVLAAYNDAGDRVELGCLSEQTGSNKVANTTPGWYEYWFTYSTPEGYYRVRWEHEKTTGGSYVYQEPLDGLGNLNTLTLRDAARVEARSTLGVFNVLLQARIPEQAGTQMDGQWNEERRSLDVVSEIPESAAQTFSANATTNVFTATGHGYSDTAQVRVSTGGTLPSPLLADTTYYVRDVTANTFKLASTSGGTAIDITTTGTGTLEVYGWPTVTYRARSTDVTPPASFSSWETDLTLVPDYEWIDVEITLRSDGVKTPVIPTRGVSVNYSCFQPVLLREDRTAFPGGCYIGGDSSSNLSAPYDIHEYDTEAPGGIALARAITERISRMDSYSVLFFSRDGVNEVRRNQLARDENGIPVVANWMIESPDEDLVMLVRFYGVSGFAPSFDYERLQESIHFWIPKVMSVESTQVLESGPLA